MIAPASPTTFFDDVIEATPHGERIRDCIQCGTCGGSCPNGADMDHSPRALINMLQQDMKDDVLGANTMWFCVSCYYCTQRCPKEIPITDLMYTLKSMAIREGKARGSDAPALARTFTDLVRKYGRSFELGLASRYYLTNKPISALRMGPLGLSMLRKGRMSLTPTRIKGVEQLQRIIKKAESLGGKA
jgi:heterodisulfide reductase subunit C